MSTCIVAWVLLSPFALAGSGLVAQELVVAGDSRLEGDAAALFYLADADGVSWEAEADAAELTREYASFRAVENPLTGIYTAFVPTAWETETISYDASSISSTHTIQGGAMIVVAQLGSRVVATSQAIVDIRTVSDPTLSQGATADGDVNGGDGGEIVQRFDGTFLDVRAAQGTYTLTGDLTLLMYGPEYDVSASGETVSWQTGEFETARTAVYAEGRQERHTLTLHNAVLQLRASEPTTLLTSFPTLAIDGTLKARQAEGALVVAGQTIAPPADGSPLTYSGAATLILSAQGGRVAAGSPDPVLTAAMIAPQGPAFLAIGAGALVAVAALLGAIALWLRRAREDDLELALVAMEDRRWEDALPRLARVARRDPDNVGVMVDRALCLEQVGRLEEAARAFEGALRAAPALAEAHFYYARTLVKMRRHDAARVHLEEALERDPRLAEMMHAEPVLRGL